MWRRRHTARPRYICSNMSHIAQVRCVVADTQPDHATFVAIGHIYLALVLCRVADIQPDHATSVAIGRI